MLRQRENLAARSTLRSSTPLSLMDHSRVFGRRPHRQFRNEIWLDCFSAKPQLRKAVRAISKTCPWSLPICSWRSKAPTLAVTSSSFPASSPVRSSSISLCRTTPRMAPPPTASMRGPIVSTTTTGSAASPSRSGSWSLGRRQTRAGMLAVKTSCSAEKTFALLPILVTRGQGAWRAGKVLKVQFRNIFPAQVDRLEPRVILRLGNIGKDQQIA